MATASCSSAHAQSDAHDVPPEIFLRMNQAAQAISPHLFTRSTIARSPELQDRNDQEKPLLFCS